MSGPQHGLTDKTCHPRSTWELARNAWVPSYLPSQNPHFYQCLLSLSTQSALLQMDIKHFGVKTQHPSQRAVHCQSERLKISKRRPGKTEVMMLCCDMKKQTQNDILCKKKIMNTQFLIGCKFINALFTSQYAFFSGLRRMQALISVFYSHAFLGNTMELKNTLELKKWTPKLKLTDVSRT